MLEDVAKLWSYCCKVFINWNYMCVPKDGGLDKHQMMLFRSYLFRQLMDDFFSKARTFIDTTKNKIRYVSLNT